VAAPLVVVPQTANDIAFDPLQHVIYLSVPGNALTHPNTISILDPVNATITSSIPTGTNPNILAISADSTMLYASMDGTVNTPAITPPVKGSVQQFALPNLTTGVNYALADDFFGPPTVLDLQVAPGAPHTTAVALGNRGVSPKSEGGVMIFDDATPRTTALPGFINSGNCFDVIQWGASPTAIFAANTDTTGADFYTLVVDANGVTLGHDFPGILADFGGRIHFDSTTNLVYEDNGLIIDPATGTVVSNFSLGSAQAIVAVDSATNSAYFLVEPVFGSLSLEVLKFNLTTHALLNTIPLISNINGTPSRLIRWGASGLAFVTTAGDVYEINNLP
jgi:trimeric autotransporter adhesin